MLSFRVQIVPDEKTLDFVIEPAKGQPDEDLAYINVRQLYEMVKRRLEALTERLVADDLYYSVTVLMLPSVSSGESAVNLAEYNDLIDDTLSQSLQAWFNAAVAVNPEPTTTTGRKKYLFPVSITQFPNAYVVIVPALRDIARHFYTGPSIPVNSVSDYQIGIYYGEQRAPDFHAQLDTYITKIMEYNKQLATPLQLLAPMLDPEFDDPLHIVFVAVRDDRLLGYCGCNLVRYRSEVDSLLEAELARLLKSDKTRILRYFMGVSPHHIFEIKALSVDQEESGKNIGLLLLFTALDFIAQAEIQRFYPVTHIVSQSASYITKRLLTGTFEFRYHGLNQFMNENFVETLNDTTKEYMVRVITEFFAYNNILLRHHNSAIKEILEQSRLGTIGVGSGSLAMSMIRDTIHVYQLYYMLIKTTVRARAFDCYSQKTANELIQSFQALKLVMGAQRSYTLLFDYIDRNIQSLEQYSETRNLTESFEKTIYTSREVGENTMGVFKEFGFLMEPAPGLPKVIMLEGYEMIYATVSNTIRLMHRILAMLRQPSGRRQQVQAEAENEAFTVMQQHLNHFLACLDGLVKRDLELRYNDELPLLQLGEIGANVTVILKSLKEASSRFKKIDIVNDLTALDKALKAKIKFVKANQVFNRNFTHLFLNVSPLESDGLDSFISLQRLQTQQAVIQERIRKKVGYSPMITTTTTTTTTTTDEESSEMAVQPMEIESSQEEVQVCENLVREMTLGEEREMPLEKEEQELEVAQIYSILIENPANETEVLFKGQKRSVHWIKEYFNRLVPLFRQNSPSSVASSQATQQPQQQPEVMEVIEEAPLATPPTMVYDYQNFRDVNYEALLPSKSIFNKFSI